MTPERAKELADLFTRWFWRDAALAVGLTPMAAMAWALHWLVGLPFVALVLALACMATGHAFFADRAREMAGGDDAR